MPMDDSSNASLNNSSNNNHNHETTTAGAATASPEVTANGTASATTFYSLRPKRIKDFKALSSGSGSSTPTGSSSGNRRSADESSLSAVQAMDVDSSSQSGMDLADLKMVLRLSESPMEVGQAWFLVDSHWLRSLKRYIDTGDPGLEPGPIDNVSLLQEDGTLKERLQENLNYDLVPQEAWDRLCQHFGVAAPQHVIKRHVISQGQFSTYSRVEVYLIKLKLTRYNRSSDSDSVIETFSHNHTLGDVEKRMRQLFRVSDSNPVRLWHDGRVILGKPSDSSSLATLTTSSSASSSSRSDHTTTLEDVGLKSGDTITIEVSSLTGVWPSEADATSRLSLASGSTATAGRSPMLTRGSCKYTPGVCGLSNIGNTCFMNSALQCLSNSTPLTEYIMSDAYVSEINRTNPLGMKGLIAEAYAALIKSMWCGQNMSVTPYEFKRVVGKFAPRFNGFQQQDSHELMAFLLDGLHEDLNRVRVKPYVEQNRDIDDRPDEVIAKESWENYKKRNDSIIVDLFHAQLKSTVVCPDCKRASKTFDPFCYLSLPLPYRQDRELTVIYVPYPHQSTTSSSASLSGASGRIAEVKLTINKKGTFQDLAQAVAAAVNDRITSNYSNSTSRRVNPESLIVTEVYKHAVSKFCDPTEVYQIPQGGSADQYICYETPDPASSIGTRRVHIPLYLRETSTIRQDMSPLFGYPLMLSLESTTYRHIIEAVKRTINHFFKDSSSISSSASDDDEVVSLSEDGSSLIVNATNDPLRIYLVNSSGTREFGSLEDYPRLSAQSNYLAVNIPNKLRIAFVSNQSINPYKITARRMSDRVADRTASLKLSECLDGFMAKERLGKDDLWYCPDCKKHQEATKKFDIWSLPKLLIIHLKRFSYTRYYRDKLDVIVDFPLTNLDMSKFLLQNAGYRSTRRQVYDLIAVSNHYGGMGGGHYTAYGKNAMTGKWYYFDDSSTSPADEDMIVSKAAYVLFYLRRDL